MIRIPAITCTIVSPPLYSNNAFCRIPSNVSFKHFFSPWKMIPLTIPSKTAVAISPYPISIYSKLIASVPFLWPKRIEDCMSLHPIWYYHYVTYTVPISTQCLLGYKGADGLLCDKRKESSGAGLKVARRSFCPVFHEDFCFSGHWQSLTLRRKAGNTRKRKQYIDIWFFIKTLAFLIITWYSKKEIVVGFCCIWRILHTLWRKCANYREKRKISLSGIDVRAFRPV